jgi:membrane-bound serine protease (ClpP class)
VRDSVSASATEAVELDVVDYVATSMDDLLAQAESRTVTVIEEEVTIGELTEAARVSNNMTFFERLLMVLSDPNIAFLLLTLGGLGLLIELFNPGVLFPGVFGLISLILAFFVLGTLPVNWAGVALILLAFGLFAAELFVSGFGALGAGGVIALIAGGLILTSSSDPDFQVSRWLVIGMGIACAVFFFTVVTAIIKARKLPVHTGTQELVGMAAVARSYLDPDGFVWVRGERWKAVAEDAPVPEGETVTITGAQGLTLMVRHTPEGASPPSA